MSAEQLPTKPLANARRYPKTRVTEVVGDVKFMMMGSELNTLGEAANIVSEALLKNIRTTSGWSITAPAHTIKLVEAVQRQIEKGGPSNPVLKELILPLVKGLKYGENNNEPWKNPSFLDSIRTSIEEGIKNSIAVIEAKAAEAKTLGPR